MIEQGGRSVNNHPQTRNYFHLFAGSVFATCEQKRHPSKLEGNGSNESNK